MLRENIVMRSACISTTLDETRCVKCFTRFSISCIEASRAVYGGAKCCRATIDSLRCSISNSHTCFDRHLRLGIWGKNACEDHQT